MADSILPAGGALPARATRLPCRNLNRMFVPLLERGTARADVLASAERRGEPRAGSLLR